MGPDPDLTRVVIVIAVGMVLASILGEILRRIGGGVGRALRRRPGGDAIDAMSGVEFEEFLAELFRRKGFAVEMTPVTGDYGVDLILTNPQTQLRIAVQAKRYAQPVGIEAVQQVFFGASYYGCQRALVVTNADYTPNARNGAAKVSVWLIDGQQLRAEIGRTLGSAKPQVLTRAVGNA